MKTHLARLLLLASIVAFRPVAAAAGEAAPEPAAPRASQPARAPLAEAGRWLDDRQAASSLGAADRALSAARDGRDAPGAALAQAARGRALESLQRPEEALAAWRGAAEGWTALHAGPEEIEALCAAAFLVQPLDAADATALVAEAVRVAESETRRPRGALNALKRGTARMWGHWALNLIRPLNSAALALAEQYAPDSLDLADVLHNLGRAAVEDRDLAGAADFYSRSLAIRERLAPDSLAVAWSLHNLGYVAELRRDTEVARDLYLRALAIRERLAPDSIDMSFSLHNLGNLAMARNDLEVAKENYTRSLEMRQRLAPDTLDVAWSLNNLGRVARLQGDLDAAMDYHRRALTIRDRLAPGSQMHDASLLNLGALALTQGDWPAARDFYQRSLEIRRRLAPGSPAVADSLFNLGVVAWNQADYATAYGQFLASLEILEAKLPDSLSLAASLDAVGSVAQRQGDLAAARDYMLRAIEIQERKAPGSHELASSLNGMGIVSRFQGDLKASRSYLSRALEIQQKEAPDSLSVAMTLSNLGVVALDQGDLAVAHDNVARGLAIREKLAPASINLAESYNNLGAVEIRRHEWLAAQDLYSRALALEERLRPASLALADNLDGLGEIALRSGDPAEAERRYEAAWRIVRGMWGAVSGDEAGQGFSAQYFTVATGLIEARIALGKNAEAFLTLEEARAQGLLELVSEQGIDRSSVDPALWERYEAAGQALVRAGGTLEEAVGKAERIARATGATGTAGSAGQHPEANRQALEEANAAREVALSSYTQARLEQERSLATVKRSMPGLEPRSFTFEAARKALPGHSVFVAWTVGAERSAVFVIASDHDRPILAQVLPMGEKQLGVQVAALRRAIGSSSWLRGIGGTTAVTDPPVEKTRVPLELEPASRALFLDLFPPGARDAIARAERVVLSPDGPLWEVPFAALVTNARGKPRWLGLEKPLSYTPSMTMLALEREGVRGEVARRGDVLVVGDPVFAPGPEPEVPGAMVMASDAPAAPRSSTPPPPIKLRGEQARLVVDGVVPDRLPATADEARRVAAIYGAAPIVGEAATESAVRAKLPKASIVHLATHGLFRPSLAMSSGLLLAPPEAATPTTTEDDGALQAWEFGRTLPLAAELVVLSACETGRGQQVRGEGLVGLTRSLQAAGARSVVASQWKVADESTADLMVAFHRNLGHGLARDEALRRAMVATARLPATRSPFFWAAFMLTGDGDRPLPLALLPTDPPPAGGR